MDRVNPLAYEFASLSSYKSTSDPSVTDPDMGIITTEDVNVIVDFWREIGLEQWVPAPTKVRAAPLCLPFRRVRVVEITNGSCVGCVRVCAGHCDIGGVLLDISRVSRACFVSTKGDVRGDIAMAVDYGTLLALLRVAWCRVLCCVVPCGVLFAMLWWDTAKRGTWCCLVVFHRSDVGLQGHQQRV